MQELWKRSAMAKQVESKEGRGLESKWTHSVLQHGYSSLPNILFWHAADLEITPAQQAVLFQLLSRWWEFDNPPRVSKARMAQGLGISERMVQRHLRALEKAGLIESQFPNLPGRHPNEYTFDGLVKKLQKIAVAYRAEKRQQDHKRRQAGKAAGKKRAPNQ
jgi:DNA-binding HxlR family transcriptional regulator